MLQISSAYCQSFVVFFLFLFSIKGGNRAGRVQIERVGSVQLFGRNRVGSIYILCFFRFLIDFDWIEGHLISDRVEFESGQISLIFF
jgi:hypothetical protein